MVFLNDLYNGIFNWPTILLNCVCLLIISLYLTDLKVVNQEYFITVCGFILIFEGYKRQKLLRETGINTWFGDLLL